MKRNNHTTSTKCQYQAAASNPKWCCRVKCPLISRMKQTKRKIVPTWTCNPWKPVAIKKVLPYTESEIWKGDSTYSRAWKAVNKAASANVTPKLMIPSFRYPATIQWWAHVTEHPERSKIIVFNNGTSQGLNTAIPWGGQVTPISTAGEIAEWK